MREAVEGKTVLIISTSNYKLSPPEPQQWTHLQLISIHIDLDTPAKYFRDLFSAVSENFAHKAILIQGKFLFFLPKFNEVIGIFLLY